jgi:hypothetical protein
VSAKIKEKAKTDPYCEIECTHCIVPSENYGMGKFKEPYVSTFYTEENELLEQVGSWTTHYVIPRWVTVPGSQYAYSPATVAALPDARLIQAMTRTILEAAEKAVDPPLLAVQEAIRSDISIFAGGITWVDGEYDGKLEQALRPIAHDSSGLPLGAEIRRDIMAAISEAFFLNKVTLPPPSKEMTAFEVGQRVSEYVRNALPLFEPMEMEYNGALCEMTFEILLRSGAFGPAESIPESLRGRELNFRFQSPLSHAREQQQAQRYMETQQLLMSAMHLDPTAGKMMDVHMALRDALKTVAPAKWIRTEKEMQAIAEADAQQKQMAQGMMAVGGAAQVAEQVGVAGKALKEMEAPPA